MDALVFVALIFVAAGSNSDGKVEAVPVGILSDITSNTIDDIALEEDAIDDDFTTHGLEHLSSAATCLVAGVEYTHGQQIYRSDPCEFCLCLDGEMFCWWQDCPPTMEGPCKDREPFTPCINGPSSSSLSSSSSSSSSTSKSSTIEHEPSTSSEAEPDNSTDSSVFTSDVNSTEEAPSTTQQHRFCLVMGRKYEIGDKLPHDTGNCVECICGPGAKVTCSPHQCAPAGDDINDYRPPGPRQQDVF